MSFIWTTICSAVSGIFGGIAQWCLGLVGMSDKEKLGRAEVTNADLKATSKTQAAIDRKAINAPSDDDVNDRLGKGNA